MGLNYLTLLLELLVNVFRGMEHNPLFCGILLITAVLQFVMGEFGGVALHVAEEGVDGKYWALSMAFGAGSLIVYQVIHLVYKAMW